ncbi:MAG: cyclic nucleotide-binding domain-containing protein [Proteobacteria bacterium]|nr:cyclic nucleotide-binding domain-containing protein [Pseudomonadota bacterium]
MEHNYALHILLRANIPLFHGLSIDELREFVRHCNMQQTNRGDIIIAYGEYNSKIYIVLGGLYEALVYIDQGLKRFNKLSVGDSMGGQSLILNVPHASEFRCLKGGVLLKFDRLDLVKIPNLQLKIYKNLCRIMTKRLLMIREWAPSVLGRKASRKTYLHFGVKRFRYRYVGHVLNRI